jgi:DNA polymerase-1
VGEAPGRTEVRQGAPFVGPSGSLLRATLEELKIKPESIYITNVVSCADPTFDNPSPSQIASCHRRLIKELVAKKIKRILVLGNSAVSSLLRQNISMQSVRLRVWQVPELPRGVKAVATYHPAAILRNPDFFADFLTDLKRLLGDPPITTEQKVKYTVLQSFSMLTSVASEIVTKRPTHLSLDLETTGLDRRNDTVISLGISNGKKVWIVPKELLKESWAIKILKSLLSDRGLKWVGHNAIDFDAMFLARLGLGWYPWMDTMLAHYCLDERQGTHDLKSLASLYLGAHDYSAEIGRKDWEKFVRGEELERLYKYQAYDCWYTWYLAPLFRTMMQEDNVLHIHDKILIPSAEALARVETNGVRVDSKHLEDLQIEFSNEIASIYKSLQRTARKHDVAPLNPNSPKQVAHLLFDKLNLYASERSTKKEVLDKIKHPIIQQLRNYRITSKLKATYVDNLLEMADEEGRIHTEFMLHGTVTGRLASRLPNLQNIPKHVGPALRNAFIATPGWVLVEADYSQLELRVAAWYSKDPSLLAVYKEGRDIHSEVASKMFKIPADKVSPLQRHHAKRVDFGILYGRGIKSLAEKENIYGSPEEIKSYVENMLKGFPKLDEWLKKQRTIAVQEGCVISSFGRKRRFPLVIHQNRSEVERQGVNAPIQSMASDVCLKALVTLVQKFDWTKQHVLLTVHDSILMECKKSVLDETVRLIRKVMIKKYTDPDLTFEVEVKVGYRWGMLHKYETTEAKKVLKAGPDAPVTKGYHDRAR